MSDWTIRKHVGSWVLFVVGAACGPGVDPAVLPVEPGPFEGTVDVHRFPGAANIDTELRGQLASVVPCDVDGDGLDDLVLVSNYDAAPLHVVHGREELLHRAVSIEHIGTSIPLDGEAQLQCLGDLDGDGAEEVSLCGHLGERTACRIGRLAGDGTELTYALELDLGPEAYPFYPTARVLDLDADGRLDLFVDAPLWDDPVRYLVADVAAELDAHAAPLPSDAIPHGVDGVSVERPSTEGFIQEVHFADLDGDGTVERLALFCPGPDGNCAGSALLIGPHDPAAADLIPPVPAVRVLEEVGPPIGLVEDFDGDGMTDLLSSVDDDQVLAFGPLDYATPLHEQSIVVGESSESFVVGDIDSNGIVDAATFLGQEDGGGTRVSLFGLSREPSAFADFSSPGLALVGPAGDFDGDGHDDFVVWDLRGFVLIYGHPR